MDSLGASSGHAYGGIGSWHSQVGLRHFEIFQCMLTLAIQIAQGRYDLQTLGPNVGSICILGSLGYGVDAF